MTDPRVPSGNRAAVSGLTGTPLLEHTVAGALLATAERLPDAVAAVFLDGAGGERARWSWRTLAERIDALAHALLGIGVGRGDRVGIWAPNRPEWLLAQFATARIGAILVNVNPAYRVGELEFALNKVGCRVLITARRFKGSNYLEMLASLAPELGDGNPRALRLERLPTLRTIVALGDVAERGPESSRGNASDAPVPNAAAAAEREAASGTLVPPSTVGAAGVAVDGGAAPDTLDFDALLAAGEAVRASEGSAALDAIGETLSVDDPINIQFTSGTTGLPKGATLTHRNIVNNAYFVTGAMRLCETDRLCIPVPFYHCFGMVMGTLGCATRGSTTVVPGEGFDAGATLDAIESERCTALYGVPAMFVAMVDSPRFAERDLSSLRTGIMAGAPCPIELMKRVRRDMHMEEVTIAYGMTETSPVSFQSATDDPVEKRVSSVGRVQPHVECKIVDERGETVRIGEQGELCTRGYSVMKGYWEDERRTGEAIDAEGWMHTGDLATIDVEGYANITGRVKDMIVRGGENVYPREIEEYLYRMPNVGQVQVFGVPDVRLGEIVCAWIVPRAGATPPTEAEVQDFCRETIAHYKVPAIVRTVEELPMTVTGKAQKYLMRRAMVEELGLEETETA